MGVFFIIVTIAFVVIFLYSWAQEGNSAKDGLWSGGFCVIILLIGAFSLLFVVNEMRSCSSHSPSYDYYDSLRK